jgi:protein SCO1/2
MLGLMMIGAVLGIYSSRFYQSGPSPESIPGLLWPDPKQLVEFNTINQHGTSFGIKDLTGRWSLLFFGYTYCPDVCPVTLTVLAQLQEKLQQQQIAPATRTIFITVDPERDTYSCWIPLPDWWAYFPHHMTQMLS